MNSCCRCLAFGSYREPDCLDCQLIARLNTKISELECKNKELQDEADRLRAHVNGLLASRDDPGSGGRWSGGW